MVTNYLVSYAQNREDVILQGFFDDDETGFYVDVGGYDPDEDSVTKHFYIKGWHGINIEPQPDRFKLFVEKRPDDTNLNVGVSNKKGTLTLRSYNNQGLSTFSPQLQQSYEKNNEDEQTKKFKDITVQVLTLEDLLATYAKNTSIQFLKVDVEGLEYEVLEGNDWKKYRPEVICIEANHVQKDWRKLLIENDYTLVFSDGLNEYYTDKNTERDKKFDYVESVIFKEPILNYHLKGDIDRYEKHIDWLEKTLEEARANTESANAYAHQLQTELDTLVPLRNHVKRQIRHHIGRVDKKFLSKLSRRKTFIPVEKVGEFSEKNESMISTAHQYDRDNFAAFSEANRHHPLFKSYVATRKTTYRAAKAIRKKTKRTPKS